jgi:hypothetical protein
VFSVQTQIHSLGIVKESGEIVYENGVSLFLPNGSNGPQLPELEC